MVAKPKEKTQKKEESIVFQWSILGPVLTNLLHTTVIYSVITVTHGLMLGQYADNCQVYVNTPVYEAVHATDQLVCCLANIGRCMKSSRRLRLNLATTYVAPHIEVLIHRHRRHSSCRWHVVVSSCLTMANHISFTCQAAATFI